ncbi:MAG: type II secretion system protein GspC, partial [Thermodesulfobacteriota bacterium]
ADGVPQGFRLFSIKVDSLIDRLGFKNGDIVQRVNGVEVTDPSTAFTLLQDLQGHSQVRVDVLRNHQPVTLSYEIR